jgi:hypothetical protein
MNSLSVESARPMPDQPLPPEVSLQTDTWLTRYRNYPVFSRAWLRYRCYAFLGTLTIFLAIFASVYMLANPNWTKFWVAAVPLFCGFSVLCCLGQGMAVAVRQRNFSARKEAILLILVLSLGAAVSAGIYTGLRYSSKHLVYGDGNIVLRFGDMKHDEEVRSAVTPKSPAGAKAGIKASAPEEMSSGGKTQDKNMPAAGQLSPLVDLVMSITQYLPVIFVILYTGSGFDLWLFFRQRKRLIETERQKELQRAQDARREAELRLSVLVAQVEPHFLFNTLAGVRSAILTEPSRATAIIDHLVDYLRATIPQMRDDGASVQGRLAQQLEAARAYLGLMQARIPRLSFSVESEIVDAAVPPLMLISLVENAIKHGVEPKVGKVHITVHARQQLQAGEAMLELSVLDNGAGFGGATSGSGIGLTNIRERLFAMFGQRASLTLKVRPEGGIAAIILLPLVN